MDRSSMRSPGQLLNGGQEQVPASRTQGRSIPPSSPFQPIQREMPRLYSDS